MQEIKDQLRAVRMQIARGEFAEARKALLGKNATGNNPEAQALDARIIGHTQGFELAHSMFLDLEAVWPDNFEVQQMHCQMLQEHGSYNDAIAVARKALQKFAARPEPYILLADNLELAGRQSEALTVVNEALAGFGESAEFIERRSRLGMLLNCVELNDNNIEEIRSELTTTPVLPDEETVRQILSTFKSRQGVHAVQVKMGKSWGYVPERRDMTIEDLRQHLAGSRTLGIYVTDINNASKLMVMDLDVRKPWLNAYGNSVEERKRINRLIRRSAENLLDICSATGLSPLVETSGNKGLHFWFLSNEEFACRYWRALGSWMLSRMGSLPEELSWEVFPKQDRVPADGLGNLVKLPLGTHQKTGRRSMFLDSKTFEPASDQIKLLREAQRLDRSCFEKVLGAITLAACRQDDAPARSAVPAVAPEKTEPDCGMNEEPSELKIAVKIPLPERHTVEVEQVLAGCRPMWKILEKARHEKAVSTDEKHAFIYIFAHLGEEGRVFIHQVMNQLSDYQPDVINAMIKAVPPNAPGCSRIRKRIPDLCGVHECNCQFRLPDGCYASPVVHAGIFPGTGAGPVPLSLRRQSNLPARLSDKEMVGGESGGIDRLMQEYSELSDEIARLRERASLLRRQINQIFSDSGKEVIETRIRVYQRLPEDDKLLAVK